MQAPSGSQRSVQRRSPVADPGPPPNVPVRAISPTSGSIQPRASSASGRSIQNGTGSRRLNNSSAASNHAAPPLSQIEKSVTHLLVATKQLLETLTQWSRHQATDTQVSDVYVRLGYEFNIACRAFTAINVDTSDLGNVPELLRDILESTLSQEASVESLERYLPKIRDIIINLLHGLKRKQQKLRQKQSREGSMSSPDGPAPRTSSVSSQGSGNSGSMSMLDQGLGNEHQADGAVDGPVTSPPTSPPNQVPPRMSSAASTHQRAVPPRDQSRGSLVSDQSSISSTTLQKGGDLERRASRRYSQYQISKLVGASPNGVPMLPTQNSPIPNRGRYESRESMRAVQNRGEQNHGRQNSTANRTSQIVTQTPVIQLPTELPASDSPTAKTPDDKLRQPAVDFEAPSATLRGPPIDILPPIPPSSEELSPVKQRSPETKQQRQEIPPPSTQERQFTPEDSPPPPDRELTIFLQYKTKVKKFVLTDGYKGLTMARLQLAFIEKFAWNTHNNGVDLPEIYIQDPISGVRHELEDMSDVKDRSVLVLNIEILDEVKRHIDDGIGGLKKIVESVKVSLDDQQATIQRVSDRQQDAAKEMARLAAAPPSSARVSFIDSQRPTNGESPSPISINSQAQLSEIQNLRRDLAVLRQTYSGFQSDIQSSMSAIRNKANSVKSVAIKAAIPHIDGESGRAYVNSGKKSLSEDSDKLVGQVDDLQDVVEDLRKDVVLRGVRPLPRQLENVAKDIAQATQELKKMQDFLKRERPLWTKIWEKELETVCNDREEMTMQEDLAADLEDDLDKAAQTFALVEQATKEQMKDARPTRSLLNHVHPAADPSAAKEGVLDEVRALQPNHENRVEAIERAEKLRQKELESRRGGEFQKELGSFVEEGRLKKSGGFEEVERARKAKDDRIRREVWERMNGVIPEPPGGEASTTEGSSAAVTATTGGEDGGYAEHVESSEPDGGVNGDAVNEI
ncbi:hypothetical protein B7463_g4455, partial [Scytalidium lignicola]